MIRPGDDIPSVEQELQRKTTLALGTVLDRLQRGDMSFQRACDALDVLWDVAAGLVARDTMDDIAATRNFCQSQIERGNYDYSDL